MAVGKGQSFQSNREFNVTRTDNVLNLEFCKFRIEAELLDDAGVLASSKTRILFALGTSNHHLAGGKDERSRLGFTNSHDDGSETLWIVLGVASVQGDRFQIQFTV